MKLNQLSIIFIIIILPMTLVLSTYIGNLVDVSNQLSQYDSLIINATYDALKALEMNDLNDEYNMQTISLERNLSGSVNSFFDSFAKGIGNSGYTKEEIKSYVPVMLYTMYDGFYLYGPHESVKVSPSATETTVDGKVVENITYGEDGREIRQYYRYNAKEKKWQSCDKDGHPDSGTNLIEIIGATMKYDYDQEKDLDQQYGIKPYTYYTCRYKDRNSSTDGYDLTVKYSLDNYIEVYGVWHGKSISNGGYVVNPKKFERNGNNIVIKGKTPNENVTIQPETLKESIISTVHSNTIQTDARGTHITNDINTPNNPDIDKVQRKYQYIVYNNIKYYLDTDLNDYIGTKYERTNSGVDGGTATHNKFDYTSYEGTNTSFSDTFAGYPIFKIDESKNKNVRVYVSWSEMQTIVDYLNRYGGFNYQTDDFYILESNTSQTYTSGTHTHADLYKDESDNVYPVTRRDNSISFDSSKLGQIANKFQDVNSWVYYDEALNFTSGKIDGYKDLNGDNLINGDDAWEGITTLLENTTVGNVESQIFDQKYKVISDGTGTVVESGSGTNKEIVASHELYLDSGNIFNFSDTNDPELDDSNFNNHRKDVIIKTIEYNLVNSISNFQKYVTGEGGRRNFDYQMPTLTDTEWDTISSEISILSFVQGLPVKRYKYYSNYALIASTKNKLYASKKSIFVTDENDSNDFDNLKYHDPRCRELYKYDENGTEVIGSECNKTFTGYSIVDFDQTFRAWKHKDNANNDVEDTFYYYNQNARGDYGCVISKENVTIDYDDIISGRDKSSVNGNGIVYKTSGCNARTAYIRGLSRRKQALYTARNPEYARVQTTRFQ